MDKNQAEIFVISIIISEIQRSKVMNKKNAFTVAVQLQRKMAWLNPNWSLEICVNRKYKIYRLLYVIFSNDGHQKISHIKH